MIRANWYVLLITHFVVLLAHLTGLMVSTVLLIRTKVRAAILAAVGFGLLTLLTLSQIALNVPAVAREIYRVGWLSWVINCCCGIADVVAIVCLIVAIWQAVSGSGSGKPDQQPVDDGEGWEAAEAGSEGDVEVLEAEPEAGRYTTVKLDETEEATYTEASPESPYATRHLDGIGEEEAEKGE